MLFTFPRKLFLQLVIPQSTVNHIARSRVKTSLHIEKPFLLDERQSKTQKIQPVSQYRQQWRFFKIFLSFFDTIHPYLFITTLDDKTENIIRYKHNNLLTHITNKRYRSKSHMFDLSNNFSIYSLNAIVEFVRKYGLEFCIPLTGIIGEF